VAWRYAVRNLQRGKGLALMSVVAVALSLGASLSYFVSLTSFEQSIVKRFSADDWDVAVDFLAPVWADELADLEATAGVSHTDPYLRGAIKVQHGGKVEPSFLLGIEPASRVRELRMVAGRALRSGDRNVIVLERKTATTLGLNVGDDVSVEARDKVWKARLVGVFSGVLPGESYAPLADAQDWFDMNDQVSGAFLKTQVQLAPDTLYRLDRVGRVTSKSHLVQEFVDHLKEIAAIVYLAFGFSLAVAVLFLFSTTAYGVLRRLAEYSTLRTIGFADRTVLKMIMLEVAVIGAVGTLVAVGAGIFISYTLNGVLSQAWFQVDTTVTARDLLVVLLPALLFFPLTAIPPFRAIVRAGMVPTLRRRAFG
jgi:ABC-type lipoprotein release transport system permease subunit